MWSSTPRILEIFLNSEIFLIHQSLGVRKAYRRWQREVKKDIAKASKTAWAGLSPNKFLLLDYNIKNCSFFWVGSWDTLTFYSVHRPTQYLMKTANRHIQALSWKTCYVLVWEEEVWTLIRWGDFHSPTFVTIAVASSLSLPSTHPGRGNLGLYAISEVPCCNP